jgi:hypothetical protein
MNCAQIAALASSRLQVNDNPNLGFVNEMALVEPIASRRRRKKLSTLVHGTEIAV